MSKTTRFEERSPEATVTQGFRLETGRFQNASFWKRPVSKQNPGVTVASGPRVSKRFVFDIDLQLPITCAYLWSIRLSTHPNCDW